MPDNPKLPAAIPGEGGGPFQPHCMQTKSGRCLADNLDQWAQLGNEAADEARGDVGGLDDSAVIIQAGRNAARILKDANDLLAQSREVALCDHCPRRRL